MNNVEITADLCESLPLRTLDICHKVNRFMCYKTFQGTEQ